MIMFGKHFESNYTGSMYGAGPVVFAVWGYVIAMTRNSTVELNPVMLGNILGCSAEEVTQAIEKLCAPDPKSRNREHEGRRLIREGEFQYHVTGWERYNAIRSEEDRRCYQREWQREYRRRRKTVKQMGAEGGACQALVEGFNATNQV